jgi:pentatricopeptide repeat domain-containing protein 1
MSNTTQTTSTQARILPRGADLPKPLLLAGLVVIFCLVDSSVHELCIGASSENSAADEHRYLFIEMGVVAICVVLPALYYHFGHGYRRQTPIGTYGTSMTADTADDEPAWLSASSCSPSAKPKSKIMPPERSGKPLPSKIEQHCQSKDARNLARWNQAINTAAKNGDPEKAERLVEMLLEDKTGLQPDTITYNSVIHARALEGNIKRAEWWLGTMRQRGIPPNTISYNIIIDACVKANDSQAAEAWLARMTEDGVAANEVSYGTVIHGHAKKGDVTSAEQWLRKMIQAGVEPNTVSYNSVICAHGRIGHAACAEKWALEMEATGMTLQPSTCNFVLDACARAGDVVRASKWMEKLQEPSVANYSSMIDACARVCNLELAELWHARMLEQGVEPNGHSFTAVINACAKAGDAAAACRWLSQMEQANVPTDVVVYSAVLDACAKASECERAKQIFTQMRARGISPNVVTYASLAKPHAHQGDWPEVERLHKEMESEGLVMNEYFLYAVLLAYASAMPRQAARAEVAFREAINAGVKVNKFVITAAVRAMGRLRCDQLIAELGVTSVASRPQPKYQPSRAKW